MTEHITSRCPACNAGPEHITRERRPNGTVRCLQCGLAHSAGDWKSRCIATRSEDPAEIFEDAKRQIASLLDARSAGERSTREEIRLASARVLTLLDDGRGKERLESKARAAASCFAPEHWARLNSYMRAELIEWTLAEALYGTPTPPKPAEADPAAALRPAASSVREPV